MDLTVNLQLTHSCASMAGQQVQVNQLGDDQARANVTRYNTTEFDPVLEVINSHRPLRLAQIFYADWYNGGANHNSGIIAKHRRSSLRFEFHYRSLRDIALVVNPDGTKFVLVRLQMVGNHNGHEWAFGIDSESQVKLNEYLGKLLPRPQGKMNPDIREEQIAPRAPVEEFAILGLTADKITALSPSELKATIAKVETFMNRFASNPHKQIEFVKLRQVHKKLQQRLI